MNLTQFRFSALLTALVLLAAVVLMLGFSRPLFTGEVYVEDDHAAYQIPMMNFYQDAIVHGDSFLWTPDILNGFYWHGEGQGGFAHPVYYLLYRTFPLQVAITLHLLISFPFMFTGTWLFLRRWQLPQAAALFGAILFTFIGINLNHYIHLCFVAVLAHVFWQLYAIDRAMKSTRRDERIAMVFLVLGLSASQLLLGCPQFTYCSWLCEMLYVLYLLRSTRAYRVMWALGAAKILSFGVAAVQILPTMDVLAQSYRENVNLAFQTIDSLHPLNALQLLSPYMYHQRVLPMTYGDQPWDAPYLGAFVTMAIGLLVLNFSRLKEHRGLVVAALALMLFGWVSSWGRYGFMQYVYDLVPVVNKMRAPARYIALSHVAMAVLGGVAFAQLIPRAGEKAPLPWRSLLPLLVLPLGSWVIALGLTSIKAQRDPAELGRFLTFLQPLSPLLFGAVLLSVAAALTIAAGRGYRWALAGIVLFSLFDIGFYSLRHKPSMTLEAYTADVDVPAEASAGARLDPDIHSFYMNRIILRDFRGVHGYVSMIPERGLDYTQVLPLQLAGVTYRQARLLGTADVHEAKLAGKNWFPLEGGFPRARLLTHTVVSDTPAEDIYTVDVATTGLVKEALSLPGGAIGTAVITVDRPGNIRVEAVAESRQLLVVSETHHPGWRAVVNGMPVETWEIYGDFIGCVVEAGDSTVQFTFDPDSWRYGKAITFGSLLACLVFWWGLRRVLAPPRAD